MVNDGLLFNQNTLENVFFVSRMKLQNFQGLTETREPKTDHEKNYTDHSDQMKKNHEEKLETHDINAEICNGHELTLVALKLQVRYHSRNRIRMLQPSLHDEALQPNLQQYHKSQCSAFLLHPVTRQYR